MNTEKKLKDELTLLKEDLRLADGYFISCSNKLHTAEREIDNLKEQILQEQMFAKKEYLNLRAQYDNVDMDNAKSEIEELKQRIVDLKSGFEGCCYACEPVALLNVELETRIKELESCDVDVVNSQVTSLYSILSKTEALWHKEEEEKQNWENVAEKLYGVVLHLLAVAQDSNILVVGPGLFSEATDARVEYEKLAQQI
jgi:hypothetical protein